MEKVYSIYSFLVVVDVSKKLKLWWVAEWWVWVWGICRSLEFKFLGLIVAVNMINMRSLMGEQVESTFIQGQIPGSLPLRI